MTDSKRFSVNSASLVDLKAELFKKQEEFKRAQLQNDSRGYQSRNVAVKKVSIWDKKNKGISSRLQKDLEQKAEEDASLVKSRSALEAKALLYDKLKNGTSRLDDEQKSLFLVDFQPKENGESKAASDDSNIKGSRDRQEDNDCPPACELDEWVDYVDRLGRSRRCMRKDLPRNVGKDGCSDDQRPISPTLKLQLQSDDMRREHQRKLWEEEEKEAMRQPVRDIHYQNVLYDEVRSVGVGYFGFSKEEEERSKQRELLNQLRKQTEGQRNLKQKLLEKRHAKMESRLAKVRERKKLKVGELPTDANDPDDDVRNEESNRVEVERKLKELEDLHARKAHVRPWDKGKQFGSTIDSSPKMTQDDWVQKLRNERNWEFAPPQTHLQHQVTEESKQHGDSSSSNQSNTVFYRDFTLENIPLPENVPIDDPTEDGDSDAKSSSINREPTETPVNREEFEQLLSQTLSHYKNMSGK